MFLHQGRGRTWKHNLQLASLLSFVAGLVNVAGFLAVARLTTNVTGHFAFFTDEVFKLEFWQAFVYFLYIFFFFLGSFCSSFLVELVLRRNERHVYLLPVSIESLILLAVALWGARLIAFHPDEIACSLLFAMGLQNSLVTRISRSVVRTTHLTGLFTDLGIELAQLLFYDKEERNERLFQSIRLRLTIIGSFFVGGIIGGVFYSKLGLHVLLFGAVALISGMLYDHLKLRYKLSHRR